LNNQFVLGFRVAITKSATSNHYCCKRFISDPQIEGPILAYATWLGNRKNPLGDYSCVSRTDMKSGNPSEEGKQLVERYCDEWIGRLPENFCFDGSFLNGLPVVRLEIHFRSTASPYEVMNAWYDGVSSRLNPNLQVDYRLSGLAGRTYENLRLHDSQMPSWLPGGPDRKLACKDD
jgi:hypothetical protein